MTNVSKNWWTLRRALKVDVETRNHPHVPDEKANLFSSTAFEDTEVEYLDLLFGLVRALKPIRILETGTRSGLSAAAMGFAAKENLQTGHSPHVDTLEIDKAWAEAAKSFLGKLGLDQFVTVHNMDSREWIWRTETKEPFDFVFFDSSRLTRPQEFEGLKRRELLSRGCVLVFHDTSTLRGKSIEQQAETQSDYVAALKYVELQCRQRLDFALSRGLCIFAF